MKNSKLRNKITGGMVAPKTKHDRAYTHKKLSSIKVRNYKDLDNDDQLIRLKQCIIHLRRNIDVKKSFKIFSNDIHNIDLNTINSRWLISILDTIVDHGSEIEKRNAMIASSFMSSERTFQRSQLGASMPELWDGLKCPSSSTADYHLNWSKRLNKLISKSPLIHEIFIELIKRASKDKNFSFNKANQIVKYNLLKNFLDKLSEKH